MRGTAKESPPSFLKTVIGMLIGGVIGRYAYLHFQGGHNGDVESMVKKINKELPMMVGDDVRMDSVAYEDQRLIYNATMVSLIKEDLDADEYRRPMHRPAIKQVCGDQQLREIIDADIAITYVYHDRRGERITRVTVNSDKCG